MLHVHTGIEIYYLIEGSVEYHIENSIYKPKPGDILVMRPGEIHSSKPDCSQPYDRINLRFTPDLLKETLNARLLSPILDRPLGSANLYTAEELPVSFIRSCFDRMLSDSSADGVRRSVAYLLPILQEIYEVWLTKEHVASNESTSVPAQIISYINQNLANLQSPQQISDAFFMSPSQIYRIFRSYTGTSVWEYVRTKRLFTARELLQTGSNPHAAAEASGYQDYSTFYRAYRKHFGNNPQDDYQPDSSKSG